MLAIHLSYISPVEAKLFQGTSFSVSPKGKKKFANLKVHKIQEQYKLRIFNVDAVKKIGGRAIAPFAPRLLWA